MENTSQNTNNSGNSLGETKFNWPLAYMKKENFKKGDTLFKKGEKADKMFYIKKGSLKLVEINKLITEEEVIGEMGLFVPSRERMATAVSQGNLEAYTMEKDDVINLFQKDSSLALKLLELTIKRYSENLKAETAARERIESELRIAHDIQNSMLPRIFPPFPERKEFDIFATMDPAKEVGGDFYDFFFIDNKKLCVIIGDVSGKGVPAALFMAISKTMLKTEALRGLPPREILTIVNDALCLDNQMCMFVTVFCLILDTETGEAQYSNGGHNPPLLCGQNGSFEFINVPKGFVVGAMEHLQCEGKNLLLKPSDTIFLYTDGVTEAMNPKKELFSENRLKESLEVVKEKGLKDIVSNMRQEIRKHAQEEPQSDDITMLLLRYNGKR